MIVVESCKYMSALTVTSKGHGHPVKSAVMVRAISITTLMDMLPASLSPISPDHLSKLHPLEGTAVNVTTVPLAYVLAAHSGGSYVMLPPLSGVLTTVSPNTPQAHIVAGAARGSINDTHTAMTATSWSSLRFLANFIPFTSRDGITSISFSHLTLWCAWLSTLI